MISKYQKEWVDTDRAKGISAFELALIESDAGMHYSDSKGWKTFMRTCYGLDKEVKK